MAIYSHSKDKDPPPSSKKSSPNPATTITAEKLWNIRTFENARDLFKDTPSASKQATAQPQPSVGATQSTQQATGDAHKQQQQNNTNVQPNPPQPVKNDGPPPHLGDEPREVNWMRALLPGSFPNARIMLCYFESSADIAPFVSKLTDELQGERKDIKPDISRPIIFIVDSGASFAVVKALGNTDLVAVTVGLILLGM